MSEKTIVADCGERPAWRVTGPKALGFLNDMLSQECASLVPGTGALGALLTEKGRIRAIVRVLATADGAVIDTEPLAAPAIEQGLVRLAPLGGTKLHPEPRRLIRLVGPVSSDIAMGLGEFEHDHLARDGAIVARTVWGGSGLDVLSPPEDGASWLERLGEHAAVVDANSVEASRIRDARPLYGVDVDDSTLINETPLLERAVSFTKGCYPGQESVARVRNLGAVRRRLVVVKIDGQAPARGSPICRGDREVGVVSSTARVADGAVALAFVDAAVTVDDSLTLEGSIACRVIA